MILDSSFYDRRNSFRSFTALGRVMGSCGWVISYRACHLDVVVFVLIYEIFPDSSRFFYDLLRVSYYFDSSRNRVNTYLRDCH